MSQARHKARGYPSVAASKGKGKWGEGESPTNNKAPSNGGASAHLGWIWTAPFPGDVSPAIPAGVVCSPAVPATSPHRECGEEGREGEYILCRALGTTPGFEAASTAGSGRGWQERGEEPGPGPRPHTPAADWEWHKDEMEEKETRRCVRGVRSGTIHCRDRFQFRRLFVFHARFRNYWVQRQAVVEEEGSDDARLAESRCAQELVPIHLLQLGWRQQLQARSTEDSGEFEAASRVAASGSRTGVIRLKKALTLHKRSATSAAASAAAATAAASPELAASVRVLPPLEEAHLARRSEDIHLRAHAQVVAVEQRHEGLLGQGLQPGLGAFPPDAQARAKWPWAHADEAPHRGGESTAQAAAASMRQLAGETARMREATSASRKDSSCEGGKGISSGARGVEGECKSRTFERGERQMRTFRFE